MARYNLETPYYSVSTILSAYFNVFRRSPERVMFILVDLFKNLLAV